MHRREVDPQLFILAAGVFLFASGSAILNQITERESDAVMDRTRNRPIPAKNVTLNEAWILFTFLIISGSVLLLVKGFIPFQLGVLCLILYNFLYTSLKKITVLAIIPGALVGAIPPLMGFTSAGGQVSDYKILIFSAFMFLWQIPHFWLLLIRYGSEYKSAGFKTLFSYLNNIQIRNLVICWVLVTSFFLLIFFGFSGIFGKYLFYSVFILNLIFIFFFIRFLYPGERSGNFKPAFLILNLFSLLIMILLITDSLLALK